MTRATEHFSRPAGATALDPRTLASPRFGPAWRTCDRTGQAFEITGGRPLWSRLARMAVQFLAVFGALGVAFVAIACAHG